MLLCAGCEKVEPENDPAPEIELIPLEPVPAPPEEFLWEINVDETVTKKLNYADMAVTFQLLMELSRTGEDLVQGTYTGTLKLSFEIEEGQADMLLKLFGVKQEDLDGFGSAENFVANIESYDRQEVLAFLNAESGYAGEAKHLPDAAQGLFTEKEIAFSQADLGILANASLRETITKYVGKEEVTAFFEMLNEEGADIPITIVILEEDKVQVVLYPYKNETLIFNGTITQTKQGA
jgi:hypothetical protein